MSGTIVLSAERKCKRAQVGQQSDRLSFNAGQASLVPGGKEPG